MSKSTTATIQIVQAAQVAERNLNRYFKEFNEQDCSGLKREFCLLRFEAALIQYELCLGMATFVQINPASFSRKVALKDLIHKVYEYSETLRKYHLQQLLELAKQRGQNTQGIGLEKKFRLFRKSLSSIDSYQTLRHVASGHYDPDISKQIQAISSIDEDSALEAVRSFLSIDKDVLCILKNIGGNVRLE